MSAGESTHGLHYEETPEIFPVDKDGNECPFAKKFDDQDIVEVKLQESISQFVVFGTVQFTDRGKFKMGVLIREGYDYLKMKLKMNRDSGPGYGEEEILLFEILNIVGREHGHLINSAYDDFTIVVALYPAYRNLMVWNISKGFKDKKIDEIINKIFDKFLNTNKKYKKKIEKTKGKLESFCIPFWNPYKTINYLKRYSIAVGNEVAGFHSFFDMKNTFHFKSIKDIMDKGDLHEVLLLDVINTSNIEGEDEKKKVVVEYYPDFVHKEFYKIGLCGTSAERFNWFKKKQYVLKKGYKKRPVEEVNKIYEKPDDINNMFGFHLTTGYRGENDTDTCSALVYNQMLTAIAAQVQTKIVVNGISNMKAGDRIKVMNKAKGTNENVEELEGEWFVRTVNHTWNTKGVPYRQVLALSRKGDMLH